MNAPTTAEALNTPALEWLPLGTIAPSETQVQAERRKRYNAARLEELAQSIRENGILQPIVVRPLTALRGLASYELVAGERRWLAAEKAEQAHILARVVPLTDQQVIKAQMVENLQREGLDTLAEAAGYKELIASGVNADAIADLVGKSRSYVYARIKLLELAPGVQDALAKREIDASQALLFARLPGEKLQEQAMKTLRNWLYQGRGEPLSFRRTAEILQDKAKGLFLPLERVPWKLDDATFHVFGPKDRRGAQEPVYLPACTECPKRSGNDPELLAALGSANVCTDKICHDTKAKQTFERRRKEAEYDGRRVLTGDEAAAIAPGQYGTRGYLDLDDECDEDEYPEPRPKGGYDSPEMQAWEEAAEKWQSRTYRQLLGDDLDSLEITLIQDPKHKSRIRELAVDSAVAKLLKAKGIKLRIRREDPPKPAKAEKPRDPEAARRAEEKAAREHAEAELEQQIETKTLERLLKAAHEKWKGPLARDDLELIAEFVLQECGMSEIFDTLFPKKKPATMNERDLGRMLLFLPICNEADPEYRDNDRPLKALCKRLKIDAAKVQKEVRAELAPKDEAAPAAKKPAKRSRKK